MPDVFSVLGAAAELERSLIVERVKAGLRNARTKGRRLGRPRTVVHMARIHALTRIGVWLPNTSLHTISVRNTIRGRVADTIYTPPSRKRIPALCHSTQGCRHPALSASAG